MNGSGQTGPDELVWTELVWTNWSGLPLSRVKPGQEWCSPGSPAVLIFLFYPSIPEEEQSLYDSSP